MGIWGPSRVLRGGCWLGSARGCRSANRSGSYILGFRLVRTIDSTDKKESSDVSAKEIGRDGRFIAYNNGTVKDTKTGLVWAAKDNGSDINWKDAKRYCENYRGGGYTDWRMPTQDELAGLYVKSEGYQPTQKKYNVNMTKLIELSTCCPWVYETLGLEAGDFRNVGARRAWFHQASTIDTRALPVSGDN